MESLERIVTSHDEIELGISFISQNKDDMMLQKENVTYYPLYIRRNFIEKINDTYSVRQYDKVAVQKYLEVIENFKPDLIQIFGSEWNFGLVKQFTDIPIVIHIQGFWPEYRNCGFPPGFSRKGYIFKKWYKPTSVVRRLMLENFSRERAEREETILEMNDNYMGRTVWDRSITKLYNRDSQYYYCSEALRSAIANEKKRWCSHGHSRTKFRLITIGAGHTLKGYDLTLRTAKLLKAHFDCDFEWILCGPTSPQMKVFESHTGIPCSDVNVIPKGKCSPEELIDNLMQSDLYVHTSYIDNSPNAVCEAQYLGLPVIATNVGGTASLFAADYPRDMLVPSNDPYYLSSKIIELHGDQEKAVSMANSNYAIARQRHDDNNIYESLLAAYTHMLKKNL